MQRVPAALLFLLLAGVSLAEETKSEPRPRLKLDPDSHAAIVAPAEELPKFDYTGTPTQMERYLVKEPGLLFLLKRRPAVEDPKGRFTWRDGGRLKRWKAGGVVIEFGLWPHIDIMAEDAKFKAPRTTGDFDMLRIKW